MVLAIDMIVPMPRSATPLLMVRANTAEGDGMLAFKYLFRESGGGKDSVIALISDNGDAHVQHGALVLVHGRDSLVSHQALLPMTLPQCSLIHL